MLVFRLAWHWLRPRRWAPDRERLQLAAARAAARWAEEKAMRICGCRADLREVVERLVPMAIEQETTESTEATESTEKPRRKECEGQ